jgi:hypothetical protein
MYASAALSARPIAGALHYSQSSSDSDVRSADQHERAGAHSRHPRKLVRIWCPYLSILLKVRQGVCLP